LERPRALREQRERSLLVERRHGEDVLAGEVQDGAARDEERQPRRPREQLDEHRRPAAQVLDVVEDEQQLASAELGRELVERLLVDHVAEPEGLHDRRDDQVGIPKRRQLDQRHAVGEGRRDAPCGLQREPGLAAAAGAGEDEEACVTPEQRRAQLVELTVPTDQKIRRLGERP
jgi:hypothetical protein